VCDWRSLSPIWASDTHGASYTLKASLPRGTPGVLGKFGPDECQFAELANGTVLYGTSAGGGNGMDHDQNRLRFPYVSVLLQFPCLHPHVWGVGCATKACVRR
jgi:hypothetical protein